MGLTTRSQSKTPDADNPSITDTYTNNSDTGMCTQNYTHMDHFSQWNYADQSTYDTQNGLMDHMSTSQDYQDGHHMSTCTYDTYRTFNDWTGIPKHDHVVVHSGDYGKATNGKGTEVDYDDDGVESGSYSAGDAAQPYTPPGISYEITKYQRDSSGGWAADPTSRIIDLGPSFSTVYETITESNLVALHESQGQTVYNAQNAHITYNNALYITEADVVYTLGTDKLPILGTETDAKGTELWIMNGNYHQSGWTSRTRTNYGTRGLTMAWDYSGNVVPAVPAISYGGHITYQGLFGVYCGSGSETYTDQGILTSQTLHNTNATNETITYQHDNDGYLTTASGTREDGVTTGYVFTGMNDIAGFSDDKGYTTYDPTTHKRTSTTGGLGTFSYTYQDDFITQINGTSAKDGTMTYDANWNMLTWTDSMGVVHSYSAKTLNSEKSSIWTQATETFTDKNNSYWSGTVTYDNWGFYYAGAHYTAHQADVHKGAVNTVEMDTTGATNLIKNELQSHYTEDETWTWKAPSDTRNQETLGQLQAAGFTSSGLTMLADIVLDINADGSVTATYTNIGFNIAQYAKTHVTNRLLPPAI